MTRDLPVYFTHDAWTNLSQAQRDLITRRRMARVHDLWVQHHARYHRPQTLVELTTTLYDDDEDG